MGLPAEKITAARCKDEWMEIVILASYGQSDRAREHLQSSGETGALTVDEAQELLSRTKHLLGENDVTKLRFWLNGQR